MHGWVTTHGRKSQTVGGIGYRRRGHAMGKRKERKAVGVKKGVEEEEKGG